MEATTGHTRGALAMDRLCTRCKTNFAYASNAWCPSCYQTWDRNRRGVEVLLRECLHCRCGFETTDQRKTYCSRSCKDESRKAQARTVRAVTKAVRLCRHCGRAMPGKMRSDARYCSAACNSHAHHQTRKASARIGAKQERIDRASIIERDGGICHICGDLVPEALITIDHVVPLAEGGTHTHDNLAVACLPCNCSKGARSVEYARSRRTHG